MAAKPARLIAGLICAALLAAGCSGGATYGKMNGSAPSIQVKDVLLDESYRGKEVQLAGKIALQCMSSGCWFFLDDGTGRMYVNLARLGLGLPPSAGKRARVSGTVVLDQTGQASIDAKGLVIRG